ncbi:acyltransferase ChoActase/COT/CPT [Hyaloraphidium curvatum]|nr:acyltransferase ChoActase/COT/CPT [Hyaloraphidium curvatum]
MSAGPRRGFGSSRSSPAAVAYAPSSSTHDAGGVTTLNPRPLPRLPVPSLEDSCERYLKSVRPLTTDDEFDATERRVEAFLGAGGLGSILQKRLQDHDAEQPESWLEDIWLRKAYLESRDPLPINSNWWCQLRDHPEQPSAHLDMPSPKGTFTAFQIRRAAILTQNLLRFHSLLLGGRVEPQQLNGKPLCMDQFRHLFGAYRRPGLIEDVLISRFPNLARHIIVMARNQPYLVPVVPEDGGPLSVRELENQLFMVTRDALETPPEPNVAILTAEPRATWSTLRRKLTQISEENVRSLEAIEEALFVLNLDDYSLENDEEVAYKQWFHKAKNRWFDKAVQIIVANNGRAGLNGEHSPCDAVVTCTALDYALASESAPATVEDRDVQMPAPRKLTFKVSNPVQKGINKALENAKELSLKVDVAILRFRLYGSQYIREVARTAPDSYVQMAMQVAWLRFRGEPTATYETATGRLFSRGRTETCRSLSQESLEFARAFDDDDVLYEEKAELFRKAATAHRDYMKDAVQGRAFDRHFLALQSLMTETEASNSDSLFSDAVYARNNRFGLSTSNVSPGTYYHGGFAPAVPDGFGINYAIEDGQLRFTICCRKDPIGRRREVLKFRDTLDRTLKEMRLLFPKKKLSAM